MLRLAGEQITETISVQSLEKVVSQTMEYSQQSYNAKLQKNVIAVLLGAIILIDLVCIIINIAVNQTISWSPYPIGALAIVFALSIPLLLCKNNKAEYTTLSLLLSTGGFLFLVQGLTRTSGWAVPLGLPAALVGCVAFWVIWKSFQKFKHNKLYAWALTSLITCIATLAMQGIITVNVINNDLDFPVNTFSTVLLLILSFILFALGSTPSHSKASGIS